MSFNLALSDAVQWDLEFDVNGELVTVSGAAEVAQRLRYRFSTFVGTWPLDLSMGLDWLGSILVKSPDLGAIRAQMVNLIVGTPGVVQLVDLDLDLNKTSRSLSVTFDAIVVGDTADETEALSASGVIDDNIASGISLFFRRLGRIGR